LYYPELLSSPDFLLSVELSQSSAHTHPTNNSHAIRITNQMRDKRG
jgi:hypothetical protein